MLGVNAGSVDLLVSPLTRIWSGFGGRNVSGFPNGISTTSRFEGATAMAMKGYGNHLKPGWRQGCDVQFEFDAREVFIPRPERRAA